MDNKQKRGVSPFFHVFALEILKAKEACDGYLNKPNISS
jgi:hypothetical protein